jgi:aminoglycoside 6'-N-acetyltransferase I
MSGEPDAGRTAIGGVEGVGVRPAASSDIPAWGRLRERLWPEGSLEEHLGELPDWLDDPETCALLAVADRAIVGFLEGRLRSHADGCATTPVAYLEGWYVDGPWRRSGIGRALVAAFETWARERGCRELASDTWPENAASLAAHRRLGFQEVDRVVTFRKPLSDGLAVPPSARPPARWEDG